MYSLLEREVVPEFYERSDNGMPSKWLERIRNSMAQLTPEFSTGRTIQNYTEEHYLPAASGYGQRAAKTAPWVLNCYSGNTTSLKNGILCALAQCKLKPATACISSGYRFCRALFP